MKIGKIIGIILLCIFAMGITYVVSKYVDASRYGSINIDVTFEDSKEFSLENKDQQTKTEALKDYPYIFTIENKSLANLDFDLVLEDKLSEGIDRSSLDYIVLVNDKEIASGNLDSIKDNILLKNKINRKTKDTYKVYIYFNEKLNKPEYSYSLKVKTRWLYEKQIK